MKYFRLYIILFIPILIVAYIYSCGRLHNSNRCIKGCVIGINPCIEEPSNPRSMRFLQVFGGEKDKIGSNFSIEDITYQNVVQAYNVPPVTEVGDTICFTYSTKVDPKKMPDCGFPSVQIINMPTIMVEVVDDCEKCR